VLTGAQAASAEGGQEARMRGSYSRVREGQNGRRTDRRASSGERQRGRRTRACAAAAVEAVSGQRQLDLTRACAALSARGCPVVRWPRCCAATVTRRMRHAMWQRVQGSLRGARATARCLGVHAAGDGQR
jgi:hypothetical protein